MAKNVVVEVTDNAVLVFDTPYSRRRQGGEVNSGELITEQAGYIPPQAQIEGMISAGIRLEEFRKGQSYDYGPDDEVDDFYEDVTRRPGFDPADASQHSLRLQALAAEERRRKKKEEKDGRTKKDVGSDSVSADQRDSGSNSSPRGVVENAPN